MNSSRILFTYGEFYDVSRMLRFRLEERWYLLWSVFDESADDYADEYDVYLIPLPFESESDFAAKPRYFQKPVEPEHLGKIAISAIGLDETRRESIDAKSFREWLAKHGPNGFA